MSCPAPERLTDDVLGALPALEHDALQAHVAGCDTCGTELRAHEDLVALLRTDVWGPSVEALSEERRQRLDARAAAPSPRPRRWPWMVAASLAAVTAVGAALLLQGRDEEELPAVAERQHLLIGPQAPPPPPLPPPLPPPPPRAHAGSPPAVGSQWSYYASEDGVEFGVEGGVEGGVAGGVLGGVIGGIVDSEADGSPRMIFAPTQPSGVIETAADPLSTFGLDVDTASYAIARNFLRRGTLPPPEAIRVEEFVNAVPQDDAPPTEGTFAVHIEAAPSPFHADHHLLRIAVKAREVPPHERKPAHLTFVIDVSGSMDLENRLGLVKRSLRLLVDALEDRDQIAIVVYGTTGRAVLQPTPVSQRATILDAIEGLRSEGATNLEDGLTIGYRLAAATFDPAATNRVILCTDGVANNGVTDPDALLKQIQRSAGKGVSMTALGFGMGNYNDALLQKLADQGDGQYAYIDDLREARRFFLRDMVRVLELVARDAKAQVAFDAGRVESYRLLGYEKRAIAHEKFRDDAQDGGELNSGHLVTVLYELKLAPTAGPLGVVRLRYAEPDSGEVREVEQQIAEDALRQRFEDASAGFRSSVAVAGFAEWLRASPRVAAGLEPILRVAQGVENARRPQLRELIDLIQKAAAVDGSR
jgi:Ca-activated chloride channel family protein